MTIRDINGGEKGIMKVNFPAMELSTMDNPIINKEKKVPNLVPSRKRDTSGKI
jgi:hypothetical protein